MSKIPGVYISIRGDWTQLKRDLAKSKRMLSEEMANSLNAAYPRKSTTVTRTVK